MICFNLENQKGYKISLLQIPFWAKSRTVHFDPIFHIFDGAGNLRGPYQAPGGLGEVKFGENVCMYIP